MQVRWQGRRFTKALTLQLGNSGIDPPAQVPQRKHVALIKSFLMDLKFLTHNGEDNKAQAELFALAA